MKRFFFASLSTIIFMTGCDSLGTGDSDLLTLKSESIIEVESNEKVVNILFDAAGTWSAESDSDWAVPAQEYGDKGEITLDVAVRVNETGEERTAVITIGCGDETAAVRIIQSADKGGDVPGIESQVLVESITETDEQGYQMKFSYEYDYIESFGKYMPVKEIALIDDEVNDVVFEYGEGYIDRILYFEGQEDKVTNYDLNVGNDEAEAVFKFNDDGYPVKLTVTAPLYKTEIIWTYTYEIDYNGRSEVLDGEVYYFDFERNRTETTGKTFQDGHVSRMYEITYTK